MANPDRTPHDKLSQTRDEMDRKSSKEEKDEFLALNMLAEVAEIVQKGWNKKKPRKKIDNVRRTLRNPNVFNAKSKKTRRSYVDPDSDDLGFNMLRDSELLNILDFTKSDKIRGEIEEELTRRKEWIEQNSRKKIRNVCGETQSRNDVDPKAKSKKTHRNYVDPDSDDLGFNMLRDFELLNILDFTNSDKIRGEIEEELTRRKEYRNGQKDVATLSLGL